MFHISVQTLRYYETIHLVEPEYTDPDSGYRYYGLRQFEILNTVRYLRRLDMPLEEILDFVQNRDLDSIVQKLQHQQVLIERQMEDLQRIHTQLQHRMDSIQDARSSRLNRILEEELPSMHLAVLKQSLHPRGYLGLEKSIRILLKDQSDTQVFLSKVGVGISREHLEEHSWAAYDCVFLQIEEEDAYTGQILTIPASGYVSVRYIGTHAEASEYYERLLAYIEKKKYTITGFSQERVLIDEGLTRDPRQFVTEIRIPVST